MPDPTPTLSPLYECQAQRNIRAMVRAHRIAFDVETLSPSWESSRVPPMEMFWQLENEKTGKVITRMRLLP